MKWALFPVLQCLALVTFVSVAVSAATPAQGAPQSESIAIPFQVIAAKHAAEVIRRAFPRVDIQIDSNSNGIIVRGSRADVEAIRAIAPTLDVRNPTEPVVEVATTHNVDARMLVHTLHALLPKIVVSATGTHQLVIKANQQDLAQCRQVIGALDAPVTQSAAPAAYETVKLAHRSAKEIARIVLTQVPHAHTVVMGASIIISGTTDDVSRAKSLALSLDVPGLDSPDTQVYRIHTVDAEALAALLTRSFPGSAIVADKSLNVISVTATSEKQKRIAEAISQLDQLNASGTPNSGGAAGANFEIVTLRSATPSASGGIQQSTTDIATALNQVMQTLAPDIHITPLPDTGQIVLMGSAYSIGIAKQFLSKFDVPQPLVVLDTLVLELDEQIARNLGLQLPQPLIATTFSELTPALNDNGQYQINSIQPITRTPLSLTVELNLLIQNGTARVLADPRITTLSGHTASIRAGDTLGILTTTGGGVGTIVTQQLQTFQTGVNLDITPLVDAEGGITVTLHPVVNSLSGILNGIPEIATRDTQTTVRLRNDQTLVIGGLIQEQDSKTVNKVPLLGDIPLVGGLFKNSAVNSSRNELVIVVTPHIVKDGERLLPMGSGIKEIPTPQPLPTVPAGRVSMHVQNSIPAENPTVGPSPSASANASTKMQPSLAVAVHGAFASTNTYTFGQPPTNNFARPTDAVQIFYGSLSPTTLASGTPVKVAVITTTNVVKVTIGPVGGQNPVVLSQIAPGQWQAEYNFGGMSFGNQQPAQLVLTASRADNISSTIRIPITVLQR